MSSKRGLVIALSVSVALNLFLLGFLVARGLGSQPSHVHGHPDHGRAHRGMHHAGPKRRGGPEARGERRARKGGGGMDGMGMRRALRGMELDEGAAALLEARREVMREHRKTLRAARKAVREAMHAEPFDPAILEAAFVAQREAHLESQAAAHETMTQLAAKLSAEQRAQLMKAGRPGRPRKD